VTGQETGIDLGIESFATLSDGARIFHPGWYRKAERALKTAQRRVSRRKKGGARRRKAIKLLAKAHLKVRRQRQDFHHKTARALARANDVISHEDLQMGQHAQEPLSRQGNTGRGLEPVFEFPLPQGGMGW
jgi:putative transposase